MQKELQILKQRLLGSDGDSQTITVYRYTPGKASWGNSRINDSYGSQQELNELIKSDKMDVPFETAFTYVSGKDSTGSTRVIQGTSAIRYYDTDSSEYEQHVLTKNEMYVKEIKVNGIPNREDAWIKFFEIDSSEPFFIATHDNLTYTPDKDLKINRYYAVANNILINRYSGWLTTYEMSAVAMKENGLTEDQILHIRDIYAYQSSSGAEIQTGKGTARYKIPGFEKTILSNFGIDEKTTLNSNTSQIGKDIEDSIILELGEYGLDNTKKSELEVINTNPIFYIELPEQFDFDITNVIADSVLMNVDSYRIKKTNGTKILQINCKRKRCR